MFIHQSSINYSGLYSSCLSAVLHLLSDIEDYQLRVDRLRCILSKSILKVEKKTICYSMPVGRLKDFLTLEMKTVKSILKSARKRLSFSTEGVDYQRVLAYDGSLKNRYRTLFTQRSKELSIEYQRGLSGLAYKSILKLAKRSKRCEVRQSVKKSAPSVESLCSHF